MIHINGKDEDLVNGVAASIRKRIERGEFAGPGTSTAAVQNLDIPTEIGGLEISHVIGRVNAASKGVSRISDAELETRMHRAFNHPWVVGLIVALVFGILLGLYLKYGK